MAIKKTNSTNKMKKTFLATALIIALAITTTTNAQVGIGVSTANIHPSAQLDVSSTTKGFLPPRMTEVQKNAINSPASGLLVYQTDGVSGYYYYDGSVWKSGLGPQGPTGPAGTNGSIGETGPQGIQGLTGAAGATGPQGATGIPGIPGATGPQGPAGTNGVQGPTGIPGATGPQGPAGLSATSTMAEASTSGSSGTYLLNPSPNNIYINAGSWISIGANNTSSYYYVISKGNDNTINIINTGGALTAWPVNATVALVGNIGAVGVAGPAGPLVATTMATSGSLSFFGSSGTFALTPSPNNVYINTGSYISIGTNNTSQYFYVSNKLEDNTITIVKESMDAGFSWPVNATVALVGPLGPNGPQGQAGIDGSDATISIGAIGTATTNGATITSGVLSLAPADESHGGIVTASEQTFGGVKTFADSAVAKGFRATDSITTNGFRATGTATANSFVKSGGTSSQYLMADGSTSAGQTATISAMQAQIATMQAQIDALKSQVQGLLNTTGVTIGTQVWKNKNLEVTNYRNGDMIPQVTDPTDWASLTTGAWCYYNNDSTNGAIYGKLYNWYAVNDSRGLAPVGYHLPTDYEWNILSDYLGGESVAGGKIKEAGTTNWLSPNTGADNRSGFTALPGGFRSTDGAFVDIGRGTLWWSSTEGDSATAWTRNLNNYSGYIGSNLFNKIFGFSVRCIKD